LTHNRVLRVINIGGNSIRSLGGCALGHALKKNRSLTALFLSGNELGIEGGRAIGQALIENSDLQFLDLSGNMIQAEGCRVLANALRKNLCLRRLDLCVNCVQEEGAQALALALMANSHLLHLEIGWNRIGHAGAESIANMLKHNLSLQHLNMVGNHLARSGAECILNALQVNTSLTSMELGGNDFDVEDIASIEALLRLNRAPDYAVTLRVTLYSIDECKLMLSCTNVSGSEIALVHVDIEDDLLRDIRIQLAEQLELAPRKVQLLLPDGRILSHRDDTVPFVDLLGTQAAICSRRQPGSDTGESSEDDRSQAH